MARIIDPNEPDDDEDVVRVRVSPQCPGRNCGSTLTEVTQMPRPGGWYPGRARCHACGRTFEFRIKEE